MRTISEASHETLKLVELFTRISLEKPITFAEASRSVGFKVSSTLGAYSSARRIALRDHNIVIEAIRGLGFKRANGETITHHRGDRHLKTMRRRARRAADEVAVAIGMNMSEDDQRIASEKFNRFRLIGDISANPRSNRRKQADPEQASEIDNRAALQGVRGAR